MRLKFLSMLAVPMLGAVVAAAPLGANAADAGALLVTGTANSAVALFGGGGTYTFPTGTWQGVVNGGAGAGAVSSSGSFDNLVCGTGGAASANTTVFGGAASTINSVYYDIWFFAGVGVLQGSLLNGGNTDITVGPVDIIPTGTPGTGNSGGGIGTCTPGFTVRALFIAAGA